VAKVEQLLGKVMALAQLSTCPVPIREFCSRPENVSLKGVCR